MSFHQRDEIRWNKKGYFERFDGKKYWRKLCVIEGCMKRAKVLNWCKRVSLMLLFIELLTISRRRLRDYRCDVDILRQNEIIY